MDTEYEDRTLREDLACIETKEYLRRAEHVHVTWADIPLPEGEKSHWREAYDGDRFLIWPTLTRYKKAVEDEEYERRKRKREGRELWVKYFTVVAATIAAAASLYTAFFKK